MTDIHNTVSVLDIEKMEDTCRRWIRWSMFSCLTTHQTSAYPHLSVYYCCTSLSTCLTVYLPARTCTCLSTYLLPAQRSAFLPTRRCADSHGMLKSLSQMRQGPHTPLQQKATLCLPHCLVLMRWSCSCPCLEGKYEEWEVQLHSFLTSAPDT